MQKEPSRTEEILAEFGFHHEGVNLYWHTFSNAKVLCSMEDHSLSIYDKNNVMVGIFELRYNTLFEQDYLAYWLLSQKQWKSCEEEVWYTRLAETLAKITMDM